MPPVVRFPKFVVLSLAVWAAAVIPAGAQQIQWRQDYNKARQEAKERNLPILMDVSTPNCSWCKHLDKTTFQDPAVVKFINENFIPLKIDGSKYKSLTSALKIESFPTIVFAAPQGKVVGMHNGYLEAAKFMDWSQQVIVAMNGPANGGLQLTAAQKSAPGMMDRLAQARALLAQAEEEFRTQQFVACLIHCKTVIATFPDLPEAEGARQLSTRLKSDPDKLRLTCEGLTQSLCELYLELSANLIKEGHRDQAVPYLQWISQACPNTPFAAAAQQMLKAAPARAPKGK